MHDDKDGSEAGGGIIAGIGFVSGVRALVTASNSAIKGGTMSPMGVQNTLRLKKIAL
jgi:geranyl-CoA carboxylase beta subunit